MLQNIKYIRYVTIIFIIVLILSIIAPNVYALTDNYNFTSNENSNIQMEDQFTYRNDCFNRSSFLGCSHLEILSAQASEASASWYGENEDKYEVNYSNNSHNIVRMLQNMGFENVATNKYYALEKKENSAGVAVGSRKLTVDNKDYTILAIIPRSAGYKNEWTGNFTVGDGDIHEGFKAARDEVLRYIKKYINDNNISGNIKVWTAGHSRGAAIANMIGGFFAAGGIEYFDGKIAITPEDVYCYTFATPRTIKDGTNKNYELSVSGNRQDESYINDTPCEAYNYTKGGALNLKSEEYGGIRNLLSANDIFINLPPKAWGFAHYGNDISVDHDKVTEEAMLNELKVISPFAYNKYINGGSPNSFERKTFDLKTLSIVKDNSTYSAIDFNTFLDEKINGLTYKVKTNTIYKNEGYEETLKAIAGTYGMSMTLFDDASFESITAPLIYSYLAYASERLQESGKADNESEAVTLVFKDLLSYFTKENIDTENFTIDDFIVLLAKYISDNENEPIADAVVSGIINLIPEQYSFILSSFKQFDKNYTSEHDVTNEEGLKAFIKACYYGSDPECEMTDFEDASKVRATLYTIICFAISSDYPEIVDLLMDENNNLNGHGNFKNFVAIILNILKTVKDDDGNVIKTYTNISELADDKLVEALDSIFEKPLEKSENLYGNDYKNKLNEHINTIKENISKVRKLILYGLLYEDGNFSSEQDVKNLTTFIGNASIFPLAHYNEIYLAYAKAAKNYDCGYEEHSNTYTCIEGDNQELNIQSANPLTFTFDIDYDTFIKEGKVFIDNNEIPRDKYNISKGSTVITFNEDFTDALTLGKHTIKASTDEGIVVADFSISKTEPNTENSDLINNVNNNKLSKNNTNSKKTKNPKTGDTIVLWIGLALISFAGIVGTQKFLGKKKI